MTDRVSGETITVKDSTRPLSAHLAATCVVVVAAAFSPALFAGFLWCDDYTVADSALMQDVSGLARIWRGGFTEQYYPLTYTLYWMIHQVFGAVPLPYHAVSILLHALNALLCVIVFRRLFPVIAVPAALWFALHPLQVESVAWIYELKNPWSALWMLLAAWMHLRFIERGGTACLAGAVVLFFASLLAKSATLIYPFLAALVLAAESAERASGRSKPSDPAGMDPGRERRRRRAFLSLIPFFIAAFASAAMTVWYERHGTLVGGHEYPQSLLERLAIAGQAFWFYAGKVLWPVALAFSYGRFAVEWNHWAQALPAVFFLVLLLVTLCSLLMRRGGGTPVALAAFLIALLPVLGFVDIYMFRYTFVADHLAYLPLLAAAPPVVYVLQKAGEWMARRLCPSARLDGGSSGVGDFDLSTSLPQERRLRRFSLAIGRLHWWILIVLAVLTWRRAHQYQSEEGLWREAASGRNSWLARLQVARLVQGRDPVEAEEWFLRSLEVQRSAEASASYARFLAGRGRTASAFAHFEEAIVLSPRDTRVLHSAAAALAGEGFLCHSLEHYRRILELDSGDEIARVNLWSLERSLQEVLRRLESLSPLVEAPGAGVEDLLEFCAACVSLGRESEASDRLNEWIQERPDSRLSERLALVLASSIDARVRDVPAACDLIKELIERTRGTVASVQETAARVFLAANRESEAVQHLVTAVRLYEIDQEPDKAHVCLDLLRILGARTPR